MGLTIFGNLIALTAMMKSFEGDKIIALDRVIGRAL